MAILGRGDLSPRRRRHRRGPLLGALVLVAPLAGGGYAGYRHFHRSTPVATGQQPTCHPPQRVGPPPARTVRLSVRNATLRSGLAARVATALRHEHFHVTSVGNAGSIGTGPATVRYPADSAAAARVVAAHVPGARLVSGSRVLELDLGPAFHGLAGRAAARAGARLRVPAGDADVPGADELTRPLPAGEPRSAPRHGRSGHATAPAS